MNGETELIPLSAGAMRASERVKELENANAGFRSMMAISIRMARQLTMTLVFCILPVACAALSDGTAADRQDPCSVFAQWSNRDGAQFWGIVPELFAKLQSDPDHFYSRMADDSMHFSDFLGLIGKTCFTNFHDTAVSYLEDKRRRTILMMRSISVQPEHKGMHDEFLETMRNLKPKYEERFFSLADYEMAHLFMTWKLRDGTPIEQIGPELLEMVLRHPNVFFEFMRTDTVEYSNWLNSLTDCCFLAEDSTQLKEVEQRRLETISQLEGKAPDIRDMPFFLRLLNRLKELRVRTE